MPEVAVRRIERLAAGLAVLIAGIHLGVALAGVWQYRATGLIPDIRTPAFVLVSAIIVVGVAAVATGTLRRDRVYSLGAALMLVHLLAYLDWHVLHVMERIVDFGDLGHGHAHGTIDRDVRGTVLAVVADPLSVFEHASSLSVVLAALDHALSSPVELISKSAELILLTVLLILRWAHGSDVRVITWQPRQRDVEWGIAAVIAGFGIWGGVVGVGGVLVEGGADPLFVHILELAAFGLFVGWLGWFSIGRPMVGGHAARTPPRLLARLPGFEPQMSVENVGVAVVYLVAFLALSATFVGFVPADGGHHHDHDEDLELDRFMEGLENRGIDVDREWSMVHYSEFHGGDALLFDYYTPHRGDRPAIESEIEEIAEAYVDAVAGGDFDDIVIFLAEARIPEDEPYVRWEIDETWVIEHLEGDRTWDELLEEILETYDPRM